MDHGAITQDGKVKGIAVECHELWGQLSDLAFRGIHAIGRRVWKCLRIAKQAPAPARCLSVCPLTKCPVE
jgi:hypothetical protein